MVAGGSKPKLLVIVGPTASGKSDLAMRVAKQFNGEIITADSRTIYKGMDIGTAKPTLMDQKQVKHWGLDLVEPGAAYSAAKFKKYAQKAVTDIQSRGKLPILAGGTGLYIDGFIYQFEFQGNLSAQKRTELEKLTTDQLQAKIKHMGFKMPQNAKNRRHLTGIIERRGVTGGRVPLAKGVLLIGLMPLDATLKERINQRADEIFKSGVIDETRQLVSRYDEETIVRTAGLVYRLTLKVLSGEISQSEAIQRFKTADWQYARRQRTWFKRNPDIHWFDSAESAYKFILTALNT
jgi:tRNA dimethylallyltransferase